MLGVVLKFSETPGEVKDAGPTIGKHNILIYGTWLGMNESEVAEPLIRGPI